MDEALITRAKALEKKAKSMTGLVKIFLLLNLSCVGLIGTMLVSFQSQLALESGYSLISQVHEKEAEFKQIDTETRSNRNDLNRLEDNVDFNSSERDIIAVTDLLIENEQAFQLFYRLLKVNMYLLTSQINGSLSWFEIYSHEIDEEISRSQSRQLQALHVRRFYGQKN